MAVISNHEGLLRAVIAEYGEESQIRMLFEEMAELQDAICKYARGRRHKGAVIEEVADVTIMIHQMHEIFGKAAVENAINEKLIRLSRRMEAGTID